VWTTFRKTQAHTMRTSRRPTTHAQTQSCCEHKSKKRGTMQRHLLVVSPGRVASFATRRRALLPFLTSQLFVAPLPCSVAVFRFATVRVLVGRPFGERPTQHRSLASPFLVSPVVPPFLSRRGPVSVHKASTLPPCLCRNRMRRYRVCVSSS
jgi:hypothetical protein